VLIPDAPLEFEENLERLSVRRAILKIEPALGGESNSGGVSR
jgi:hypothetical protein